MVVGVLWRLPDFHRLRLEASRTNQGAWVAQVAKRYRNYLLLLLVVVVVAVVVQGAGVALLLLMLG